MSASLTFQRVSRTKLVADAAVTALVPAANIVDANARPEVFPRIVLGEDQEIPADDIVGRYTLLVSTIHLWHREPGLAGVKAIADAVTRALRLRYQAWTLENYRCHECKLQSARFIRDPDGLTAHGIVTLESIIEELT